MNIPQVFDWRSKRNLNPVIQTMNYSTYSLPDFTENKTMKGEIYDMYSPDIKSYSEMDKKMDGKNERSEPWLLKSALHMCAMIYRKFAGRASSPDLSYHDCESPGQESPSALWQAAKTENKNIEAHSTGLYTDSDMSGDYKSVVATCEDKLNKVRQLITTKPAPSSPKCTTYRSRRRRRVFVEAGSIEDSFEDAFCPENFVSESNSDALAFIIPYQYQNCELLEIDAPKMKIEKTVLNIKNQVPENKGDLNLKTDVVKTEVVEHIQPVTEEIKTNIETVSSCESKIMQLQAMLKERRKKNTKTILNSSDSVPEPVKDLPIEQTKPKIIPTPKIQDKRYKNRHRLARGKRKKAETKKMIQDDMVFADEIAETPETPSSFEHSPIISNLSLEKSSSLSLDKSVESLGVTPTEDCFDEVAGRFRSASGTESDDSFQVVFTDSPRAMRPSDCESEDSFIFFEDSPDSCYTSNDVFGDESESEYSDTDSEVSDSGCGDSDELKMSHNMTKTFEDLTDDRLYEENKDVVDSAVKMCVEIPNEELDLDSVSDVKSTGLLLDDAKRLLRKNQPAKKVHFSEKPPKVHVMRVWAFAARQARAGHWERHALDRERFKRRIADADMALSWVLKPQHRSRVMFQRFMPWWNAQRRKEIAEKKVRDEEEKKLLEEQKVLLEEQKKLLEEQRIEEEKKAAEESEKIGLENSENQSVDDEYNRIGKEICAVDREIDGIQIINSNNENDQEKVQETQIAGNIDSEKDKNIQGNKDNSVTVIKGNIGIQKDVKNIPEKHVGANIGARLRNLKIKEEKAYKNDTQEKQIIEKYCSKKNIQNGNKNINEENSKNTDKLKDNQNIESEKGINNNSAIVSANERTTINNTLKSVPNHLNQNKVNMELILKEDKCLKPLTVNANEAVS